MRLNRPLFFFAQGHMVFRFDLWYTKSMSFFRKEKPQLSVALDVGSRTIKGIIFSQSVQSASGGPARSDQNPSDQVLRADDSVGPAAGGEKPPLIHPSGQEVHKRIAIQMSSAYSAPRIVAEVHNLLAGIIKEFGR